MYVKIIYYNERSHGYGGRGYTYRTELPLKIGDKVLVPVGREQEGKRALVIDIDLPDSEIDPAWADKVKEIAQYDQTDMQIVR